MSGRQTGAPRLKAAVLERRRRRTVAGMSRRLQLDLSTPAAAVLESAATAAGLSIAEYLRRALNTSLWLQRQAFANGTVIVHTPAGGRCALRV